MDGFCLNAPGVAKLVPSSDLQRPPAPLNVGIPRSIIHTDIYGNKMWHERLLGTANL